MTYKYQSDGTAFIAGVPTRDLTEAEFKALPKEQQEECMQSGLYLPADPPAKTAKSVAVTNTQEADNG